MRQAALLASVAAIAAALLTDVTVAGQEPGAGSAFVAFRVDFNHVIATFKVMDTSAKQVTDGLSAEPMARFGYRYFDPPAPWREQGAADMRAGDRWLIHSAPGQAFQAETERIVGGNAGCQNAIGALLRVVPEQSDTFTGLPAKYFLAERSMILQPSKAESGSSVGISIAIDRRVSARVGIDSQRTPRARATAGPSRRRAGACASGVEPRCLSPLLGPASTGHRRSHAERAWRVDLRHPIVPSGS